MGGLYFYPDRLKRQQEMIDPFWVDRYLVKNDAAKKKKKGLHLLKPQPSLKPPNKCYIDSKSYPLRGFYCFRVEV